MSDFGRLLWKLYDSDDPDHREAAAMWDNDRERIKAGARLLIEQIGAPGPESLGDTCKRAAAELAHLKTIKRIAKRASAEMDTEGGLTVRTRLRLLAACLRDVEINV